LTEVTFAARWSLRNQLQRGSGWLCSLLSSLLGGGFGWSGSGGSGWSSGGGWNIESHGDVLASNSLLLSDGVLGTSGLSLSLEVLLTESLSLLLVDSLNQDILVLELVTLGSQVKSMVHLSVDLLGVSIFPEKSTENTGSSHPDDLMWHTGISSTLPLSSANVSSLSLGLSVGLASRSGVSLNLSSHDELVFHKLSNVLA